MLTRFEELSKQQGAMRAGKQEASHGFLPVKWGVRFEAAAAPTSAMRFVLLRMAPFGSIPARRASKGTLVGASGS